MTVDADRRALMHDRSHALCLAVTLGLLGMDGATAFPLIDPSNVDQVPRGTELATPDQHDLRHQLQIVNGLAAPASGGWTFVPRIDFQEMLTDNVLQQHSPRQPDLVSYFAPGFSLAGDLPRISLDLSYAPTLAIYARESSLNAVTQQMTGIGLVTLVPDLAFVDLRALSGVQNAFGGLGGQGGVGAAFDTTSQTTMPSLSGNAQGLTRNNEVQTSSIGIAPYLLSRFGDWGTGKLGDSLNLTRSNPLSGFISSPFPSGGGNGQTLISNEQDAHFVTGDIMGHVQDTFDADLIQSQNVIEAGAVNPNTGLAATATTRSSSTRAIVSDQVTYQINRSIAVFVLGGHEDIVYSGAVVEHIHDLIWSLGATVTPGPNSQLTASYGHLNGFNSLSMSGYYTLTPRTMLTVSYGSTLGTQLENLRDQLNAATAIGSGTLVNARTGGPLFGATNALAVQNGVFRTDTLTMGSQTRLDRDIITFNLLMTKQTSTGSATSTSATAKTFSTTWIHEMRPDLTLNAALAFSIQDQSVSAGLNPGNNTSIVAGLGWQYQISDTLSTSLRYSFFQRRSAVASFDLYQNMLILGVSKTF